MNRAKPQQPVTVLFAALVGLAALVGCTSGEHATPTAPSQGDQRPVDEQPTAEDDALECSDASRLELYNKRIAPLLSDERPSSCNRCHLSGTHLNLFVAGGACEAMSCLIGQELVDLDAPEESKILDWISRARPESSAITDAVVEEEYQGFLEWIQYSAECHDEVCADAMACPLDPPEAEEPFFVPCAEGDRRVGCAMATGPCAPEDTRPECQDTFLACAPDDTNPACTPRSPGCTEGDTRPHCDPCSSTNLEALFVERIFPWRGRCSHCHEVDSPINAGSPPKWMELGDSHSSAARTIANLDALGALDRERPIASKLLLKPLAEAAGGVEHGGSTKFVDIDDPAFVDFQTWVETWAACETRPQD